MLVVKFFTTIDDINIYSDPLEITIGQKCGFGDIPINDWEKILIDNNISREVFPMIERHFKDNPPTEDFDEDDVL